MNIEERHWQQAADLSFRLRRKGITISAIDAIISVIAIDYSCELLHYDSDFNLISEHSKLKIVSITPQWKDFEMRIVDFGFSYVINPEKWKLENVIGY